MKSNLLDKAIRLILGIVSILPQKRSGTAKSDTKTPARAAFSKALPQADKNLKPEATKAVSSAEPQKSSKTIPAIPTEAVKEEKINSTYQRSTLNDPKDLLETKISPDGNKKETKRKKKIILDKIVWRKDLGSNSDTAVISRASIQLLIA